MLSNIENFASPIWDYVESYVFPNQARKDTVLLLNAVMVTLVVIVGFKVASMAIGGGRKDSKAANDHCCVGKLIQERRAATVGVPLVPGSGPSESSSGPSIDMNTIMQILSTMQNDIAEMKRERDMTDTELIETSTQILRIVGASCLISANEWDGLSPLMDGVGGSPDGSFQQTPVKRSDAMRQVVKAIPMNFLEQQVAGGSPVRVPVAQRQQELEGLKNLMGPSIGPSIGKPEGQPKLNELPTQGMPKQVAPTPGGNARPKEVLQPKQGEQPKVVQHPKQPMPKQAMIPKQTMVPKQPPQPGTLQQPPQPGTPQQMPHQAQQPPQRMPQQSSQPMSQQAVSQVTAVQPTQGTPNPQQQAATARPQQLPAAQHLPFEPPSEVKEPIPRERIVPDGRLPNVKEPAGTLPVVKHVAVRPTELNRADISPAGKSLSDNLAPDVRSADIRPVVVVRPPGVQSNPVRAPGIQPPVQPKEMSSPVRSLSAEPVAVPAPALPAPIVAAPKMSALAAARMKREQEMAKVAASLAPAAKQPASNPFASR